MTEPIPPGQDDLIATVAMHTLFMAERMCIDRKLATPAAVRDLTRRVTALDFPTDVRDAIAVLLQNAGIRYQEPSMLTVTLSDGLDPFPDADSDHLWARLGLKVNTQRQAICNLDNAIRVLDAMPDTLAYYDEFHQRIFSPRGEWSDADTLNLTRYMQGRVMLSRLGKETVYDAVCHYAREHVRNEPRDWMATLKWDGKPRIDEFLTACFGADDSIYTKAVSRNFWIGMAARVHSPGCKLDTMMILEGAQGLRKSTALDVIGGKWHAESSESIMSKDFIIGMQGVVILEISDLSGFDMNETERVKKLLSCRHDRYRAPYARSPEDHPRMGIIVGTTNQHFYLRDDTGARRFWPILCRMIDIDSIHKNREQLFAEAVHRFKTGEGWHEVPAEALDEQESRRQSDAWQDVIHPYLIGRSEVRIIDIATDCLSIPKERVDQRAQRRIGAILRLENWLSVTVRDDGMVRKAWVPKV